MHKNQFHTLSEKIIAESYKFSIKKIDSNISLVNIIYCDEEVDLMLHEGIFIGFLDGARTLFINETSANMAHMPIYKICVIDDLCKYFENYIEYIRAVKDAESIIESVENKKMTRESAICEINRYYCEMIITDEEKSAYIARIK